MRESIYQSVTGRLYLPDCFAQIASDSIWNPSCHLIATFQYFSVLTLSIARETPPITNNLDFFKWVSIRNFGTLRNLLDWSISIRDSRNVQVQREFRTLLVQKLEVSMVILFTQRVSTWSTFMCSSEHPLGGRRFTIFPTN